MAENPKKRTIVLAVLDGWGYSDRKVGNPLKQAKTPGMDQIAQEYPLTLLQASGLAVGMVWGESGNSEVGHLNIGAGRIIEQYYSRINRSIKDQTFFTNPAIVEIFNNAKNNNSSVHLVGLLTSGTVHAAFNHLVALVNMAGTYNPVPVFLHLFLDGRDSGLQEGVDLIIKLNDEMAKSPNCKIASVMGRDFAMDRDNNWERTRKAHDLIAKAEGEKSEDVFVNIKNYYANDVNDSGMPPIVVSNSGFNGLSDKDSIFFFNFREDSVRQILSSFADPDFTIFPRTNKTGLFVASMTKYLDPQSAPFAIPPPEVKNGLSEILSLYGKKQLHIAETEKYAHVTYFFNGLRNLPFDGETDIFIESVKDIEANPEMSSTKIADKVVESLDLDIFDFIVLNFANADLLAHTGNYEATVKGIEAVDHAVNKIAKKVLEKDGVMVITADHGNAESLIYHKSGEAETKHDDSPVAFYLVANQFRTTKDGRRLSVELKEINGILPDVAPTVLELMGLPQPEEMTGKSLLSSLIG